MRIPPILICAALLASPPLFGQAVPDDDGGAAPQPPPCETPEEVIARVHFERALRAWLEGRREDARAEAKAGLDASPTGRFAPYIRGLLNKIELAQATPAGAAREARAPSARAEMVVVSTLEGALLGGLTAAAVNADGKGAIALVMGGTALGILGSVVATQGGPVKPAYPAMFEAGGTYGAFASLIAADLVDAKGNIAGLVGVSILAGNALGLGAAYGLRMTGGDAGASFGGLLWGAGETTLVALAIGGTQGDRKPLEIAALVGGSVGAIALPLLNRQLDWSLSRWRLINLGGSVGALFGLGIAVLADATGGSARGAFGLMAGGAAAGLAISILATQSFDADEPREQRSGALLDVSPQGKVRIGSLAEAINPVVLPGRAGKLDLGASVSLLAGRF